MQDFSSEFPLAAALLPAGRDPKRPVPNPAWAEKRLLRCRRCSGGSGCDGVEAWSLYGPGEAITGFDAEAWQWEREVCGAWRERQHTIALRKAGIPPRFRDCRFATFVPKNESQAKALDRCRSFAEGFRAGETKRGLFLLGAYGVGKTHLAVAVAASLADRCRVRFRTVPALLAEARSAIRGQRDAADPLLECCDVPLLLLDDLGQEKNSDWVWEQRFLLINYRYEQELPTVFTSNLAPEALQEKIGGAAMSRIWDMCAGVAIDGEDHRKRSR